MVLERSRPAQMDRMNKESAETRSLITKRRSRGANRRRSRSGGGLPSLRPRSSEQHRSALLTNALLSLSPSSSAHTFSEHLSRESPGHQYSPWDPTCFLHSAHINERRRKRAATVKMNHGFHTSELHWRVLQSRESTSQISSFAGLEK